MSAKSIFEADGKAILSYHLTRSKPIKPSPLPAPSHNAPPKLASLHFAEGDSVRGVLDAAEQTYPWLLTPGSRFVAKPDQLIKRRGKSGLLCLNKEWPEAKAWIEERAGKDIVVEGIQGVLRQFLVEPFVPHKQEEEYYININSVREVSRNFCQIVVPPAAFPQVVLFSLFLQFSVLRRIPDLIIGLSGRAECNPSIFYSGFFLRISTSRFPLPCPLHT